MKAEHHISIKAARGFTLAEMLVALSISSILSLAALGALRAGLQVSSRIERLRGEEQARQLIELLSVELTGLYYPNPSPAAEVAPDEEDRESAWKLSFYTVMPGGHRGNSNRPCGLVTYLFKKGTGSGPGILTRREQLVAGDVVVSEPQSHVIANGLSAFEVQLFDERGAQLQVQGSETQVFPRRASILAAWLDRRGAVQSHRCDVFLPTNTRLLPEDSEGDAGA